jgi:hypothetical protein
MPRSVAQKSTFDLIVQDQRPMEEWLDSMTRLVPELYRHDAALSRELGALIGKFRWTAHSLECARTDDPSTPEVNAAASTFLEWRLDGDSPLAAALRRAISRADQLLGRRALLALLGLEQPN